MTRSGNGTELMRCNLIVPVLLRWRLVAREHLVPALWPLGPDPALRPHDTDQSPPQYYEQYLRPIPALRPGRGAPKDCRKRRKNDKASPPPRDLRRCRRARTSASCRVRRERRDFVNPLISETILGLRLRHGAGRHHLVPSRQEHSFRPARLPLRRVAR